MNVQNKRRYPVLSINLITGCRGCVVLMLNTTQDAEEEEVCCVELCSVVHDCGTFNFHNWKDYVAGFGDEHWLGLEKIY